MSDLTPEAVEELKRLREKSNSVPHIYAGYNEVRVEYRDALESAAPALIRAAEENATTRERIAKWMVLHSVATGHGDTAEDLLDELDVEISQLRARLAKAEGALKEIAESPHCAYGDGPFVSEYDSGYKMGVADGHRCAATTARNALASYSAKETE